MAVASLATLLGSSAAVAPARDLAELAAGFDIASASKSAARSTSPNFGRSTGR
jgi:hypothetical protein